MKLHGLVCYKKPVCSKEKRSLSPVPISIDLNLDHLLCFVQNNVMKSQMSKWQKKLMHTIHTYNKVQTI